MLIIVFAVAVLWWGGPKLLELTQQERPGPTSNGGITPSTPKSEDGMSVQAWVYPGEPGCSAKSEMADGRSIDVLKPEYFTISQSGRLELLSESRSGCNGYSTANVDWIKKYSEKQFVTVSAHVTEMRLFLRNTDEANKAVETLIDWTVKNNFTGAELDWEDFSAWSETDYQLFLAFVKKLGSSLHAKGKELMVDGPAIGSAEQQGWYRWKYEDFSGLPVDWLVIMAYDYQADAGTGQPIAPNAWVTDSVQWVKAKTGSLEKIVLGVPAYGYTGKSDTYLASIKTAEQMKSAPGYAKAVRNNESGELEWRAGETAYVLADGRSLTLKRQLARELGITHISVWHLGGNEWFTGKAER